MAGAPVGDSRGSDQLPGALGALRHTHPEAHAGAGPEDGPQGRTDIVGLAAGAGGREDLRGSLGRPGPVRALLVGWLDRRCGSDSGLLLSADRGSPARPGLGWLESRRSLSGFARGLASTSSAPVIASAGASLHMAQRKVLTIFLASPGDLAAERDETRHVVERLNRFVTAHLGWHIDLLGWEDTSPGFARPQEKINADVDACDLFLGLIWQRWGSPTGTYTSGFHEEFERALNRRRSTQSPEIWLFFKKVPEDRLVDPGEQLLQVINFRKVIEERRELLFHEFNDVADWSRKIYDWLATHTIRLSQTTASPESESSTPAQSTTYPQVTSQDSPKEEKAASRQILQILAAFQSASQKPNPFQDGEGVDSFTIARLSLFSTSWLSANYSHDILGAHEVNLLYRYRDQVELFHPERILLLRTAIGNSESTAPGWYWFQSSRADYVFFLVAALALGDVNAEVRKRAIKLLAAARKLPDKRFFDREAFLSKLLEEVPHEAMSYIIDVGGRSDLKLLEAIKTLEATVARLRILARHKPESALEELLFHPFGPPQVVIAHIQAKAHRIPIELLERALKSSISSVRLLAFEELRKRGTLTRPQVMLILQDPSLILKQHAIEWLIADGVTFIPKVIRDLLQNEESSRLWELPQTEKPDPDRLIRKALSRLPKDELEKQVEWFSPEGHIAYQVLAEDHFATFGSIIRDDLRTDFSRIQEAWRTQANLLGEVEGERLLNAVGKYNDFIRSQFTISALSGLAKNGTPDDRGLAIAHLESKDSFVALASIEALRSIGLPEDAEILLSVALGTSGLARLPAASAAVHLVPGINGPARELLASNDVQLATIALDGLKEERLVDIAQQVESLLLHPQDVIRERALAFLSKRATSKYLSSLLTRYLEREAYFYNVVYHLDRVLYAPEPLRSLFKRELVSSLKTQLR